MISGSKSPKRANAARKAQYLRNLAQRLEKPALGNGRVQIAAKRLLELMEEVSTADVAQWSHGRRLLLNGLPLEPQHYRAVRRALRQVGAIPCGRGRGMGRPTVWRMGDRPREW